MSTYASHSQLFEERLALRNIVCFRENSPRQKFHRIVGNMVFKIELINQISDVDIIQETIYYSNFDRIVVDIYF